MTMCRTIDAEPFRLDIDGQALFGLRAGRNGTRGLVVALHGGGYDARYWHHPGQTDASLLLLGAALGFDVVAFDRPGNGGSTGAAESGYSIAEQRKLLFTAIDRIAGDRVIPVYLIGHSLGAILALAMAADDRAGLATLDVSGVSLHYTPRMRARLEEHLRILSRSGAASAPAIDPEARRALFYGADGTFDPVVVARGDTEHPVPTIEMVEATRCPEDLPAKLGRIVTAVQWTIPVDEGASLGGQGVLDEVRNLLVASPHVVTALQMASGHNISLHHVARAYHLRAFAFSNNVAQSRRRALPLPYRIQLQVQKSRQESIVALRRGTHVRRYSL